jgi:uncharacterized membrane protein
VWLSRLRQLDWVALLVVLLVAGMLMVLSIMRHTGYNTSMLDLGNMSQAMWSGTQGRPLEFTFQYGNISRLALHVEIIYWLFIPLYTVLPDPRTLLVVQAILFAAGAWPVYRLAMRHLKRRSLARAMVLVYLFFPVAQTAVLFDFHGDTLAMPLLLFALEALDRRAWRSYAFWIVLALLCKFYVAVAVAVLGFVIWLQGQRRAGGWTLLAALVWFGVAVLIIKPWFAPYSYAAESNTTFLSYLQFYFDFGPVLLDTAVQRILTLFVVFLPGLWLGRYAWRWALPAFAIAGPALISLGDGASYDYRFHHYAITVPFLMAATMFGAVELRRRQEGVPEGHRRRRRPWQGELFLTLAITLIFAVSLVDTPLNPKFWSGNPNSGMSQWRYGRIPRDTLKDRWLNLNVPPRAPLAANEFLAPHLANRQTLAMVGYSEESKMLSILDDVQYVVADALHDYAFPLSDDEFIGGVLQDAPSIKTVMEHPEFDLLVAQDGLLLFGRNSDSREGLAQTLTLREWEGQKTEPRLHFQEHVGLLSAQIEPVGGRRFRLRFEWVPLQPLDREPPLFAVSRLEGVDHGRIAHLPTLALYPTSSWHTDQIVEEEFEIELPPELPAGSYRLLTGWYDGENLYAASTDASSRVGEEFYVGTIVLE